MKLDYIENGSIFQPSPFRGKEVAMKQHLSAFLLIVFVIGAFIVLAIVALVADLWDKLRGKKMSVVDYHDDYYYDY
ncbi:MAG: hypothetical protein NTZ42_02175 [Candidatus Gribaldobacteria bacterium]|nr:hypothetical protein [Candidatus Gribaldobacteria bacterium]